MLTASSEFRQSVGICIIEKQMKGNNRGSESCNWFAEEVDERMPND
jgi:hypothetical protein